MKNLISYLLVALLLAACSEKNNPLMERKMLQMLDDKDFFRLETRLEKERTQLSKGIVMYFDAHLQNAFNRTGQSLQTIDVLLNRYGKLLNDSLLSSIYQLKADNLLKLCRYGESVETLKTVLDNYSHATDSVDFQDAWDAYNIVEPLKEYPPQKIHITADVTIPISRNQFGHVIMQVSGNGQSEDFIFDTGAALSVVSESSAPQLGIRVLESSSQVENSLGNKIQTKVGIADSLRISGLLFENVVFLVLEDEALSFPELNYAIHGIVGFPVMYQMKEIRIRKDESITVPAHPTKRDVHNLFLDGLSPVVHAVNDCDTLLFTMDTGANISELSKRYLDAHKNEILEKGTKRLAKRGGAGGIIETEIYKLENFRLRIGGYELILPSLSVETDEYSDNEKYDGNLGQDALMYFNQLILNFEDMYLTFEN